MSDLDRLRMLADQLAVRRAEHESAREELHDAIRDALANGVEVATVSKHSGISKPRIYQIRDRRR
ncbi:hypothetical protein [Glutamicibacter sp. X7]